MTILVRHSGGSDARRSTAWLAEEDRALAQRLSRFHRRHLREELLRWLATMPIVLIVLWAVIAGASSLFVH